MSSNRRCSFVCMLLWMVAFLGACSPEFVGISRRSLTSIAVTPDQVSIADGTQTALTAMGTFTDGSVVDLTSSVVWSSSNQAVASVTHGSATGLSVGTAIITAGDTVSGVSGSMSLEVTAAILTLIEVAPAGASIALGTAQPFTAIGVFSDSSTADLTGTVAFSAGDPSIVSWSGSTAHSLSIGSTTVTAADLASGVSGTATVDVTAAVLTSISVTPTNPSIALGTNQAFTAMGTFTDLSTQDLTASVAWTSSNGAVAVVSNAAPTHGVATSVAAGSASISATDSASGTSGSTSLAVTPAVLVSLAITPTNPSIALGTNEAFTAVGTYSDATTQDLTSAVTWSSSNAAVVTVSNVAGSQGLASSASVGSAIVTALHVESGIDAATNFDVTSAALTSIAVTPDDSTIALGTTAAFTAIGTFTDHSTQDLTSAVTWSSSDTLVALVSNAAPDHGLATSVATGGATITATDSSSGISGSTTLTVSPAVLTSISILPSSISIALGRTESFTATGTFSDATTQDLTTSVTWSSSDAAVATVSNAPSSEGLVTSVSLGSITLTALEPASGIFGVTSIEISPAVLTSLSIAPTHPTLALGFSQQFTATGTFSDATTQDLTASVTWSSSDELIATVSNASGSEGTATSVAVGTAIIAALDPTSGVSDSTTFTVTPPVPSFLDISPDDPTLYTGNSLQFAATLVMSDGSTADFSGSVIWSTSDSAVADANGGLSNGFSSGTTTVSAFEPSTGFSDSTTLTVTPPPVLMSISLSPTDPSIAHGSSIQFSAIGFYSDGSTQDFTSSVTWSSSDPSVADVSGGFANGLWFGSVTIAADDSVSGFSASTSLTVYPALTGISISPSDPTIAYGSSIQFSATGDYSDGSSQDLTGSLAWSSSDGSVADVSGGYANSMSSGSTTITAYDPSSGTSASTTLTVDPPPSLTSIDLSPTDPTLSQGFAIQFSATGNYSDGSSQDLTASVSWGSSDGTVADVNGGYSYAYSVGSTTISVYDPGTGTSASTTLTVVPLPALTSISISPTDVTILPSNVVQFSVTAYYADGSSQDITGSAGWSSSDTYVADVSYGLATGNNDGSATITASDSGFSASATLTVSSTPVLTSLSISPTDTSTSPGGTVQFIATGYYNDGSSQDLSAYVSWSSSDTAVADMSGEYASAYTAGSTTITAYDSGSGQSASTTLYVNSSVSLISISISPSDPTITQGDTLQFTATGNYSDGSTQDITGSVSWWSWYPWIADVSGGSTTGYSPGWTTITAYDVSSGIGASTGLTVN